MTGRELINELKKMDLDKEVLIDIDMGSKDERIFYAEKELNEIEEDEDCIYIKIEF